MTRTRTPPRRRRPPGTGRLSSGNRPAAPKVAAIGQVSSAGIAQAIFAARLKTVAGTNFATTTVPSVVLPTVTAGDRLWVAFYQGSGSTTVPATATSLPGGWDVEADLGQASGTRAGRLIVVSKVAAGNEGGTTISATFPGSLASAAMAVILSAPSTFQDRDTHQQAGVLTVNVPTSTATGHARGIVFAGASVGGQFSSITAWGGATERRGMGAGNHTLSVATFSVSAAGASPAVTANRSANNTNCAWMIQQSLLEVA